VAGLAYEANWQFPVYFDGQFAGYMSGGGGGWSGATFTNMYSGTDGDDYLSILGSGFSENGSGSSGGRSRLDIDIEFRKTGFKRSYGGNLNWFQRAIQVFNPNRWYFNVSWEQSAEWVNNPHSLPTKTANQMIGAQGLYNDWHTLTNDSYFDEDIARTRGNNGINFSNDNIYSNDYRYYWLTDRNTYAKQKLALVTIPRQFTSRPTTTGPLRNDIITYMSILQNPNNYKFDIELIYATGNFDSEKTVQAYQFYLNSAGIPARTGHTSSDINFIFNPNLVYVIITYLTW